MPRRKPPEGKKDDNRTDQDISVANHPFLSHQFKMVAFDWDGTAVMGRDDDATELASLLQQLMDLGVVVVIITGTNFENIDRQVAHLINGPSKSNLFVCTNRGSQVYGFDNFSQPVLLWQRVATQEENAALSAIADDVRRSLESKTSLKIDVIYDRLNRRKIDLIPLKEWQDPPKSDIGDLLRAVENRLVSGGLTGGLSEALELAQQICAKEGLREVRITSDVKHIEIGLTDKGDSIAWMMMEIAKRRNIRNEDVLIAGDEFGPIAGFPGSDYRMALPGTKGATFISVGQEPNGVPDGIAYLGGGPTSFREILRSQLVPRQSGSAASKDEPIISTLPPPAFTDLVEPLLDPVLDPTATERLDSLTGTRNLHPDWLLIEEGFNAAREHEIESLFTVSNGYVGTRGSLSEGSAISRPATLVAGVFDKHSDSQPGESITAAPDWACMKIVVGGKELSMDSGTVLEHRRILDLKQGLWIREWRQMDHAGRITRTRFIRFASLADKHALYESVSVTPENYTAEVSVESIVDGRTGTVGAIHPPREVAVTGNGQAKTPNGVDQTYPVLTSESVGYRTEIAFAIKSTFHSEHEEHEEHAEYEHTKGTMWIGDKWSWEADIAHSYCVVKLVSVFTSRDTQDAAFSAATHLDEMVSLGAASLVTEHLNAWKERWKTSDIEIGGDHDMQLAVRFAVYHLISAAGQFDTGLSIGARGLTGSAYMGHIFWDTDIFMLPFYVYTHPASARSLLHYRHTTLPAAKDRAQAMGYAGALYAWESTLSGQDVTPPLVITPEGEVIRILSGQMEHHISADIAYAVWQYWQATRDDQFMKQAGAEILIETARFWATRVTSGVDQHYHVLNVIGPDEFHENVDDNAYTNMMAQFNLDCAARITTICRERWPAEFDQLSQRLNLTKQEQEVWQAIAMNMYTGFNPDTGLFEQFKGYFNLEHVDLSKYESRSAPMDVVLGREEVAKTQVIKQADVILAIYLLWDRFAPDVREANFRYYEPRTSHGSSLSPAIYSLVAARLDDRSLAERYFRQTAEIDLANNMGNAAFGIHMGALGGLWQAATFGFQGIQLQQDGLEVDPKLPAAWESLKLSIQWQGRLLRIDADREASLLQVSLEKGNPMVVVLGEHKGQLIHQDEKLQSKPIGPSWGTI